MKRSISFSIAIIFCCYCFGQIDTTSKKTLPTDYSYYMKKSRNQKMGAWVLLGGGVVMMASGLVVATNEVANSDYILDANTAGGEILFFVGIAAAGASIPFFISSAKNKGRAMSLSLKTERAPFINSGSLVTKPFPAVSLKVNL